MTTTRTHRTRTALVLATAALLTLSACGGGGDSGSADDAPAKSESSQADAAGSDLTGIPDVVAEVNGEAVTKDEFAPLYEAQLEQAASQAEMGGAEPDEEALQKQTVDNLVDTELLTQEADSRGIEVSDEDVDAELDALAQQNGMESADAFLEAIAQQGVTEEQARSQVQTQVMVEELVADENGPFEPTEKDLRKIYAQAKQQQATQGGQELPAFEDVRDQIEEQARAQEVGQAAGTLLTGLRKDADITIHL
ncbi:SurA N-terminal domain-containing protein [Nocardioides sp. SYSU D00065]|uniref:SurA N-terminal domain-containing protein n=1 Tax=Nocardioides sp. SYSU D00065 TaxID=2817378 RepID=UPI001B3276FA|nr:SurA N-terminal domain-containing protein [Nocardioides sp. SYSU D00065]